MINTHLHKASIFVQSHVDRSINKLDKYPFKVDLEQIKNMQFICDESCINILIDWHNVIQD